MSFEGSKSVRVVPSGQIYRQMFDAQLQLSRSLSQYDVESKIQKLKNLELTESHVFPLVHLSKEDQQHGILNSRQKTWTSSFPNDPYTENPVLFRQYKDYVTKTSSKLESSVAGKEVRGLPDVVVSQKTGSSIIDRIAESRKNRHESAVEDLHQDLSVLNIEMEPVIESLSAQLMEKLSEDGHVIESILKRIEKDEDILKYKRDDLSALWKEVQHHTPQRQAWIQELDGNLKQAETARMDKIKEVFTSYGEKLHTISHLMPADLQRFLDRETQMINQTVLSNRRAYADLYVRLISSDIEREKSQRIWWRRRLEDWKSLLSRKAIEQFREFMGTAGVTKPPSVENVKETLLIEQSVLNVRRLELIKCLSEMKPPTLTKSAVYKWRQDMKKLTEELDNCTKMHMSKLHEEYERVCQMCLEKMDACKTSLIDSGISSQHRANIIVDQYLLPLVGEQQRVFENMQEEMERMTDEHNNLMEENIQHLFRFAQGAAHLWDSHEIGLAKQERALQEKLEQCRQKHDHSNQEKEANLDIVMDRMRQDASEMALKNCLVIALTMLETIRGSYEEFHVDQTDIVQTYPDMVEEELNNYDSTVCDFFSLMRRSSDVASEQSEQDMLTTRKGTVFLVKKSSLKRLQTRDSKTDGKEETIQDQSSPDPRQSSSFLTEVVEDERAPSSDVPMPDFIQSINIPHETLVDVKKAIRFNVLDHLEDWCQQALERAHSVVLAKCEELNSELDLRLHLHHPRPRRAELDIHNVRAAELVMHSERAVRHCNGMEKSLSELHTRFKAMSHEHNKLANAFKVDIEALEVIFVNATKSARLVKLQNQVTVELEKFMSVIRTSLRQFRQHLDETLQMLRESNARFIKSFKVFSDGGNFSPEEIDEYRKKLEKMSSLIDQAEGTIMSELEGMESKRLDAATKISVEFEDRFKSHMSDLVFMERVARWLTNTQVKIKSEVANSNTDAQRLEQMLKELELRVDACERPNLDKEQITATELNNSLAAIFKDFSNRMEYLNCGKSSVTLPRNQASLPSSSSMRRASFVRTASVMSKVGFSIDPSSKSKSTLEDPSVNVIKSILKPSEPKERTQKNKMRFGTDAELDGDCAGFGLGPATAQDVTREKTKSVLSQASSDNLKSGKKGSVTGELPTKRVQSGTRRTSKLNKFDKKTVFGDKTEEEAEADNKSFMATIQLVLKEALDGLLTTAEVFYQQKGPRPVTRPQVLQETYETCADLVTNKLQSYMLQADEYHNQCLQEFRAQMVRLEKLTAHVPSLVIKDLLKQEIQRARDSQANLIKQFQSTLDELAERQNDHKSSLRPTLGHPNEAESLDKLCVQERKRHEDYTQAVSQHTQERQENVLEHSQEFLDKLAQVAEVQLLQYDTMLIVDDVEKGRVDPKRLPTSELIRRHNAGEPLEDEEDKDALPRGKASWIGIPCNQFVLEGRPSKLQVTATVPTRKNTMAHTATVKARDRAYEDYKEQFEHTLLGISKEKDRMLVVEKRWEASWDSSVEKVKMLYQ